MTSKGLYSPPNGIIANVVLHDLDLNFNGKKISNNILEMVKASAKICVRSFYRF